MPVKIYLYIFPTENLDVPEMPLVICVWICRGTETQCGFDKGLNLFALLLSGSPWRLAALENNLSPLACHLLPSLFWPRVYEVIFHRWFSYLESPHPDYIRRGCVKEDWLPLKELCLHDLTQYTDLTYVLLSPTSSVSYFPVLVSPCPVFHVTKPCFLSGHFTFVVSLVSVSLLLYLARGLLSWWVSSSSFTWFESEKAKSLRSFSVY